MRQSFTSLLAPDMCRLCDLPLLEAARHPVCDDCLALARAEMSGPLCELCGEALGMESARAAELSHTASALCAVCAEKPPAFLRATAFGIYGGALRELIHLLKYEYLSSLAAPLGNMLADAVEAVAPGVEQVPVLTVVAVPIFRRKRPFNQSELLAAEALRALRRRRAALSDGPQPARRRRQDFEQRHSLLRRTRSTGSQFTLSRKQRRRNIRGAFSVAGDVSGLHILLVDDIYTTGATAAECTRVLLAAGAASVRVATLARAQRESAELWHPRFTAIGAAGTAAGDTLPHERLSFRSN